MAVLLATILIAAGGCTDDDPGTASSGSGGGGGGLPIPSRYPVPSADPVPPANTAPLGDKVSCPDGHYPKLVVVPADLIGFLQACTSASGGLLLKNMSPLMLQVQAPDGLTSIAVPTPASNDLRSIVNAELAAGSSSYTAVVVPPGGYTTAAATNGPAAVTVGISLFDASKSYAADVWVRYVEDRMSTRQQRFGKSAASCVQESVELWNTSAPANGKELTQLVAETALGPAYQCRKLLKEVSDELNEEPPKTSSALGEELAKLRKGVKANVWDDLVGWARQAVKLI